MNEFCESGAPLVSVVIPVKDRPKELLRSIESVLRQTLRNFEIVVVENNSKSPRELENILVALEDDRIMFHSIKDCRNANVARNYGCRVARGKYISFLDSDDEYEPEHLARCVALLKNDQSLFVYGCAKINNGRNIRQVHARALREDESPLSYLFGRAASWAPTPTYMVSRIALRNIEWDENIYRHQDFDFFIQVVSQYPSTVNFNPDVVINWPDGVKRQYNSASMREFFKKWSHLMSKVERRRYSYSKIKNAIKQFDVVNLVVFSWVYIREIGPLCRNK